MRTYVGSGTDSANLAKQLRSDRTSGNKLQPPQNNRNMQRQRHARRWRKYLPPRGRNLCHFEGRFKRSHFISFYFISFLKIIHLKRQKMVPFSNGRWTLYSEVIKKDEYDESVHSSIVGLSCPNPPTERGIMRVPHTM